MTTEVVQWTADDFLTAKPYEYLYGFREDPFEMAQEVAKMRILADGLNFKGFVGMWKLFLQKQKKSEGLKFDNATEFSDQPMELYCQQYTCSDFGIFTSAANGSELSVCSHPIMPIERLVNIDNGEERLRIAYRNSLNRPWRDIIVQKSAIASSNAILQMAERGVAVNSENAKALSTYLMEIEQRNYDEIPETKSVSRLGWVGDHGFSPYVEDLTFDGDQNFSHMFNAVKCCGDYDVWKNAMLSVRKSTIPARLALAAGFASAILEPCALLPFFLHFWGGTENGKTVGLMIAASIWANPKMGEYLTSFNSTSVGQEMVASFLNSLPMCIDELQIQAAQGAKDFDKLIYLLTEGTGKTRGTKTGVLQKQNKWHCCFITSGEQPITTGTSFGGAVNRIIEYECGDKIFDDLVGLCQIIQQNYGYAGIDFVKHLQEEGTDRVISIQKSFYRKLLESDSTDKQAASASAILTADALATEWIFKDDNALTVEELSEVMTKKDQVNANYRAYEYVMELIERNHAHFVQGDTSCELWGKIDPDCICIFKSVFDREMNSAGFNPTAFLSWAKRNGKIKVEGDRRTKKVRFGDTTVRVVCIIKENYVEDVIDDDEIFS